MGVHVHEHCLKMARREDGTPWWSAFPEPSSSPVKITWSEVARLLQDRDQSQPREFLLVDTRRTDCIGGTIQGSLNIPAHSFYLMRVMLYDLCKQAGIKRIVFYCGECCPLFHCIRLSEANRRGQAPPTAEDQDAPLGCRTISILFLTGLVPTTNLTRGARRR
ncbi:uncharacterized protein PODANS_1_670 [Podospora anserina S mat+]|uniref:Podospora anserina S mat+ genomic DNA chromosome 1, supercontig 1 n=1 Tax=Podospora anserina (strain S / ATCC MYA-4624 / DSM 980 / FGSC 10383) TaxID=515849 RepID=B2A9D5_PODAN|nr:uncharacterized protein PODANS_1_670 [Podospora anserina S mat+]CAP59682.1 unnamed protein product [Podospora anserina S mat+]